VRRAHVAYSNARTRSPSFSSGGRWSHSLSRASMQATDERREPTVRESSPAPMDIDSLPSLLARLTFTGEGPLTLVT
jgi:hypothetical protein